MARRPPRADVGALPDVPGPHRHPRLSRHPRHRAGGRVRGHRAGPDRRARRHRGLRLRVGARDLGVVRVRARLHHPGRRRPRAHAHPGAARVPGGGDRRGLRRLLRGGGAGGGPLPPRRRAPARHARGQHPERAARRAAQGRRTLRADRGLPLVVPGGRSSSSRPIRRKPSARVSASAGGTFSSTRPSAWWSPARSGSPAFSSSSPT